MASARFGEFCCACHFCLTCSLNETGPKPFSGSLYVKFVGRGSKNASQGSFYVFLRFHQGFHGAETMNKATDGRISLCKSRAPSRSCTAGMNSRSASGKCLMRVTWRVGRPNEPIEERRRTWVGWSLVAAQEQCMPNVYYGVLLYTVNCGYS